jgi:hypothetical protein
MTAPAQTAPPQPPARRPWWTRPEDITARLVVRWAYIAALTVFAFRPSLVSLVEATREGSLNGYVWTVPLAGILAAIGVAHRERTELPIHDRQTDIIVGTMGLVLSLLLHAVLLQRYALHFHLLRLDLFAMWMFVLSSCIVLFGLRPVMRFAWVWVLLLMVFPLPYHIMVILMGGGKTAAGAATLLIAAFATGIAVGRTWRRGFYGSLGAWVVGFTVLLVMNGYFPDAPLLAYQQIPALSAIAITGSALFLAARRGEPVRILDRKVEPLAAREVWLGFPLVLVVAIALSFVRLPSLVTPPPAQIDTLTFEAPLVVPAGWHQTDQRTYPRVNRLYGDGATMIRQQVVADVGNPEWDKLSQPRTLILDTTTSSTPFLFGVYPSKVVYNLPGTRFSTPRQVDLGSGVTGELVSVIDDNLLITWNTLQWTWRNETTAQRITLIAVDNHDDGAPFPQPANALVTKLNTLLVVLFRGNSAISNREAEFKDAELLTQFGRGLITAQLHPAEARP